MTSTFTTLSSDERAPRTAQLAESLKSSRPLPKTGAPQKTEKSYAKEEFSQAATGLQLANGSHSKPVLRGNLYRDELLVSCRAV